MHSCMYVCLCGCVHVYICAGLCMRVRVRMRAGACMRVHVCACVFNGDIYSRIDLN